MIPHSYLCVQRGVLLINFVKSGEFGIIAEFAVSCNLWRSKNFILF